MNEQTTDVDSQWGFGSIHGEIQGMFILMADILEVSIA